MRTAVMQRAGRGCRPVGAPAALRPQRPSGRPGGALAPRLLVRAAAAQQPSTAELRAELDRKERQLASMFESGRPMPKASDVAQLRAEISALADQLAGRPVQPLVPPTSHDAPLGLPTPAAGAGGRAGPGRGRSRTEELAYKAYEMVEEQLRSNQGMGAQEDAEVARLEAENVALRAQAYELLKRQQQLETLLAEARGNKPPELLVDTAEDLLARMRAKLQRGASGGA